MKSHEFTYKAIQFLLFFQSGADPYAVNSNGQTPLDIVKKHSNQNDPNVQKIKQVLKGNLFEKRFHQLSFSGDSKLNKFPLKVKLSFFLVPKVLESVTLSLTKTSKYGQIFQCLGAISDVRRLLFWCLESLRVYR